MRYVRTVIPDLCYDDTEPYLQGVVDRLKQTTDRALLAHARQVAQQARTPGCPREYAQDYLDRLSGLIDEVLTLANEREQELNVRESLPRTYLPPLCSHCGYNL